MRGIVLNRPSTDAALLLGSATLLALVFFLAFGIYSYHPSDHGWILGYAWRVFGGQTPYVDFVYRRPPVSIHLLALWFVLPDGWVLLASRLGFYLQLALSGAFISMATRRLGLATGGPTLALLSISFAAVAIHNFPSMAWNTVDGVFFSSVGLAALLLSMRVSGASKDEPDTSEAPGRAVSAPEASNSVPLRTDGVIDHRSLIWRGVASVAFCTAALSKQPFAVIAVAFAAFSIGEFLLRSDAPLPDRARLLAASALPALALITSICIGLTIQGAFGPMLEQIFMSNFEGDLRWAGFRRYWRSPSLWLIVPGVAWSWVASRATGIWPRVSIVLAIAIGVVLVRGLVRWSFAGDVFFFVLVGVCIGRAGLLISAKRAGQETRAFRDQLLLSLGVASIAWCASLSWGAPSPLLGLAGMGAVVAGLIPAGRRTGLTIIALTIFTAATLYLVARENLDHPYANRPIQKQMARLDAIYPRFGPITTNYGIAEHYRDLRQLVQTHALDHGKAFTVLDDFPLIHYMVDAQNPALMDWYWMSEVRGVEETLLEQLLDLDAVFLLYRGQGPPPLGFLPPERGPCTAEEFQTEMPLKAGVFEARTLIDSTRFFCVLD